MSEKRRKKKVNKARVIRNIVITVIVLGLITAGIIILRKKISEKYAAENESQILTTTAETGSISTTVYGSGRLSDDDVDEITIPDSVEIDEIRVSAGDTVAEGDVLATVDTKSVISAMSVVQSEIDALDAKLEDAENEEIESSITTAVSGRVKEIYAQVGDSVTSVMTDKNALMVLSADGHMAVDLSDSGLTEGAAVTVKTADGTEYEGTVKYVSGQNATVLFSDEGPVADEEVTVLTSDGTTAGSGVCYINSPVTIMGYAGSVESIDVSKEDKVSAGTTLFTLTDTEYTINFETILKERNKLQEELSALLEIYKKGAICSTIAGSIKTVPDISEDTSSSESSSRSSSSEEKEASFKVIPNQTMTVSVSIDETNILSLEVGQQADVSISSIGDETYTGTITAISKSGTSSDGVTQYTADIQIEKQDKMMEGMSAEASIKIKSVENTIIIAKDALNETSTSAYVYTSYDEEKGELGGLTEVTIGISNNSYVEITEGLAEGTTVYYKEKQVTKNSGGSRFGGFGGGSMPDFGGGSMPDFGGGSMPDFGGGSMPGGGSGSFPSMPGGGSGGSSRPNKEK
jgi:multidrug efflux pump subunit AcrA (membrane-fusion protein)